MAFIYSKETHSVRNDETGSEITVKYGMRDGFTYPYQFRQGDLQFVFEVIFTSVPYIYHTTIASDITGLPKGSEMEEFATDAVYLMEQSFRRELCRALNNIGKSEPTKSEYSHFKNLIQDGMSTLVAGDGKTLQYIPNGKVRVEFESNMKSYNAKYPGKLKNFNPDYYPGLSSN